MFGLGVERGRCVGEAGRSRKTGTQSTSFSRIDQSEGVASIASEGRRDAPFTPEGRALKLAILSSDEAIAAETWAQIERGEIDILVGTQMVAKGHHFPSLTLVGVVDADVGLQGADLRAGERTYQLLHQLGGRAGRGDQPGTVLIQTYEKNHPIMQALTRHDRDAVMQLEAQLREQGGWPPYGQLVAILLDGTNDAAVRAAGQQLARTAPQDARIRVLGPAPAPLSKLRGQFRYRLLVKIQPGLHPQRTLRAWLKDQKFKGVRVKVDVNPYYFL
jgi:primosomal protein N' (replication factor Y)